MREDAAAKGRRLLAEGRLIVTHVGTEISGRCRGDSGEIHAVGHVTGKWYCSCPALGRCSHLIALQLVTLKPDRALSHD